MATLQCLLPFVYSQIPNPFDSRTSDHHICKPAQIGGFALCMMAFRPNNRMHTRLLSDYE